MAGCAVVVLSSPTLDNAMTLSPLEKKTLVGPLVVGCLLGAFVAYAVFAFASELALQDGKIIDKWKTAAEAVFAFLVVTVSTVGLLGILPKVVRRRQAKGGGNV